MQAPTVGDHGGLDGWSACAPSSPSEAACTALVRSGRFGGEVICVQCDACSGVVKGASCLSLSRSSSSVKLPRSSAIFLCRCVVLHPTQCSEFRQTVAFPFVTQSVHFCYPRSCLRSNSLASQNRWARLRGTRCGFWECQGRHCHLQSVAFWKGYDASWDPLVHRYTFVGDVPSMPMKANRIGLPWNRNTMLSHGLPLKVRRILV